MAADLDMISVIRTAEEQAAKIKKDADARAVRLLADAERDSAEKNASQSARFYEQTAKLRENAEKRSESAADFILKELFAL